ncbi:uncharacterized protein LOC116657899 isoform X2 [Camelus ferus]|uniref:Uncharacterized protein LOC116657899 isoform X2 n=1 Tax=Camelus ferus TaxID=419612 RepID=A0A8B8RJZ7_CAMFR|nr:uncharacterized protein LOC116657899 isoform X2 [Camelus ferus]
MKMGDTPPRPLSSPPSQPSVSAPRTPPSAEERRVGGGADALDPRHPCSIRTLGHIRCLINAFWIVDFSQNEKNLSKRCSRTRSVPPCLCTQPPVAGLPPSVLRSVSASWMPSNCQPPHSTFLPSGIQTVLTVALVAESWKGSRRQQQEGRLGPPALTPGTGFGPAGRPGPVSGPAGVTVWGHWVWMFSLCRRIFPPGVSLHPPRWPVCCSQFGQDTASFSDCDPRCGFRKVNLLLGRKCEIQQNYRLSYSANSAQPGWGCDAAISQRSAVQPPDFCSPNHVTRRTRSWTCPHRTTHVRNSPGGAEPGPQSWSLELQMAGGRPGIAPLCPTADT